jgi:ABC-2 type transport system ATP-binding protein
MPASLVVRNLCKRYGLVQALDGVSLEIATGEVLGLLGPNGAGKTTAVEAIAGLCQPDRGEIRIGALDARRNPAEAKQRMGVALASTGLQDKITAREAIESFGAFYRRRARTEDLLIRFDLMDLADRPWETLSTGQKQRLSLAISVVNEPDLIVLDEPSAGLDAASRREMHAMIGRMKDHGAVLLTTHDMDEAENLCDRVAILNRGRIVADGTPADLIAKSRNTTTISLRTAPAIPADILSAIVCVGVPESDGSSVKFTAVDVNESLGRLIPLLQSRGIVTTELQARKATLEEVIEELIGPVGGQSV